MRRAQQVFMVSGDLFDERHVFLGMAHPSCVYMWCSLVSTAFGRIERTEQLTQMWKM